MQHEALITQPPRMAVGAVVIQRLNRSAPQILLVKRAHPPRKDAWSLPGGRVEPGERLVDAVRREVREETNLDVQVGPLVEVVEIIDPAYHYVILDYVCEVIEGVMSPGDDASDVQFVSLEDLHQYSLTEAVSRVIHRALEIANGK